MADRDKIKQKLRGRAELPSQAEFLEAFFKEAGGPAELAKLMWREFNKPTCPPQVRGRILDMVLRVLNEQEKKDDPERRVGEMTDTELEKFLDARIRELDKRG